MSENQQSFAYGKDTIKDCQCPASAAGYSPAMGDESTEVALEYDSAVRELGFNNAQSIISREEARNAWMHVLEENKLDEESVGYEIANEFGWTK